MRGALMSGDNHELREGTNRETAVRENTELERAPRLWTHQQKKRPHIVLSWAGCEGALFAMHFTPQCSISPEARKW